MKNDMRDERKIVVGDKVKGRLRPFPLTDVRLGEGLFKRAMEANARWLLSIEPDRLLSRFRQYAGLEPKGLIYGGWESGGLSGHSLGHHLTACALMVQAGGDPQFLDRVIYIVDELDLCQQAHGNGFISGVQDCNRIFGELAQGIVRSAGFDLNGGWAPWYTQHKLFAGLRDAWLLCDNAKARDVLVKLADWATALCGRLDDELFQKMLRCEYGGMNEVMADVYAITGDPRHMALAQRFYDHAVLDPLMRGEDGLTGLHGNTQIPKLIGLERQYELTGEERLHQAAKFFWEVVVRDRSYVIGGNTDGEYFHEKDRLSERLSDRTCETCNTYNMLKLTKQLFLIEPTAEMADYSERALYNHIVASQNPENGMTTYMMPLRAGCAKGFCEPFDSFWCCTGTSMENHAKYGEYIYFHDDDSLVVNLFEASTLDWREKGVRLEQQTRFPEEDTSRLVLDCDRPVAFTLRIRHPHWVKEGFALRVNGEPVTASSQPGSYAEIRREWRSGDTVEVRVPMTLRTEAFADNPHRMALLYGPVVLCAETEVDAEPRVIVADPEQIAKGLRPTGDQPLAFKGSETLFRAVGGEGSTEFFIPLYAEYQKAFTVYWDAYSESEWAAIKNRYEAELEKTKVLEKRTIDFLQLGEMQPERDHELESARSSAGLFVNRKYRQADARGWFSFTMKVDPARPMELLAIYSGTETCTFEILVDGETLATQRLADNNPGEFVSRTYAIPAGLTVGKERVIVKFQPVEDSYVGRVFGCRMMLQGE